jgi:hypothetical protein
MIEYCVCRHRIDEHDLTQKRGKIYCVACFYKQAPKEFYWVHEFQLDNLRFIEDLAKQKHLI